MTPTPNPLAADPEVSGIPAYGTQIQVLSSSSPEGFTSIAGAGDITGPGSTLGEAETTSHSTGVPVRSFIPTLIDAGSITFPCFWNPSDPTQAVSSPFGMEYLFANRIITKFQLVIPDPTHRTRQFRGFVNSLSETYPIAGICTRNIGIRITTPLVDVAPAVSLTPSTAAPIIAGGPGTVAVKTGGIMTPWSAVSNVAWITITAPTTPTVGDEDVAYTVASNPGAARTGEIQIAALNLTFVVNQAGS